MSMIVWHTSTFLPITLISIDALKERTDYLMKIWQWSSQGWAVQRDLMRIHMPCFMKLANVRLHRVKPDYHCHELINNLNSALYLLQNYYIPPESTATATHRRLSITLCSFKKWLLVGLGVGVGLAAQNIFLMLYCY